MGLRFRKSIKIAPGIKINFNKKSWGVTFGKRGAHYTINSKGKQTASLGIPGTGLSYTTTSGGKSKKKASPNNPSVSNKRVELINKSSYHMYNSVVWMKFCKYFHLILGIALIILGTLVAIAIPVCFFVPLFGIFSILLSRKYSKILVRLKNGEHIEIPNFNPPEASDNVSDCDEYLSDKVNIPTYFRQIEESIELIQNSKNPETVISRFSFIQDIFNKLENVSADIPNWDRINSNYKRIMLNKNTFINAAIKRALDAELIKINQLKTERGKNNRLHRFFEKIRTIPDLPSESVAYLDNLEQVTHI